MARSYLCTVALSGFALLGACQLDFGKKDKADDVGDGGDNSGGSSASTGESSGANDPSKTVPSVQGFSTLGGRRTDVTGKYAVYDDGFEGGPRLCASEAQFCVTGGFSP